MGALNRPLAHSWIPRESGNDRELSRASGQNLAEAVRDDHLLALHQRLGVDVNTIVPLRRQLNCRLAVLQLIHDLIAALPQHR